MPTLPPPPSAAPCRARIAALALGAATALGAAPVLAQSSPWYIGASQTVTHESNVLRLADGQAAPAGYSRSDTISSTALLAGLDQPFGRQRAYGTLALRRNQLSKNSIYDNDSYTLSGGLDWSTVERLSGTLTASADRSLASFSSNEIGLLTRKNLRTTKQLGASVRLGLATQFQGELSLGRRTVDNSLDERAVRARDYRQDTASVGLRWRPSGVSSFGVALRGTQGSYPRFEQAANGDFIADRFDSQDLDLTANYEASGESRLDLRVSLGRVRYDRAQQRDFDGVTGALGWNWRATGKLQLRTRLYRDTGQDSYPVQIFTSVGTSDYTRTTTGLSLQADYEATAKIGLTSRLSVSEREVVRTLPPNPFVPSDASGRETVTIFSLGARWAPLRNVLLGCDASTETQRSRGQLTSPLSADRFGCYGQITLQ